MNLKNLVQQANRAYKALGRVDYNSVKPSEIDGQALRRSLYVVKDIAKGELFTRDMFVLSAQV